MQVQLKDGLIRVSIMFTKLFADNFLEYDPFNASYRNKTQEIESPAVSHVFGNFFKAGLL